MAQLPLKMTVVHRGRWGRFAAHYENAGTQTVHDAIEEGAKISRALAPVGTKPDPRTIPLKASIDTEMTSRNSGRWLSTARHAHAVEFGSRPHTISARVRFWWEAAGRWWIPGEGFIHHPGNQAQPFMRPAYDVVKRRLSEIARKRYRT